MSRIYGFLGGVLTTTSVAYLTVREVQANSNTVSTHLQQSKQVLDSHGKPRVRESKVLEYESRNSMSETMKDLWNHEISRAVTWLFSVGSSRE